MTTQTFKTTINCGGCISKVTSTLNNLVGESNWNVDTSTSDKILTIQNIDIIPEQIISSIQNLGFQITLQQSTT
ncbi:MAG: heavy-metal-associated domain-containing protein [Bacteroidetes bacterium]|nr:heavy-metal-associated domain-containing protein [Bacteroidota bacterium]